MAKKRKPVKDLEILENNPVLYYAESISKLINKEIDRELKQILNGVFPDAKIRI